MGKLYDNNNTILKIGEGDLSELIINHCTFVPGRTEQDNLGRLLFSWENIPDISDDVNRLKKYLFDILNEEWIMGNGVIFNKEGPNDNIITVSSSSDTDNRFYSTGIECCFRRKNYINKKRDGGRRR